MRLLRTSRAGNPAYEAMPSGEWLKGSRELGKVLDAKYRGNRGSGDWQGKGAQQRGDAIIITEMSPKRHVETQLRRIVWRLSRQFRPDRIVLFGSRARGDYRKDSDVDLLVIMPVRGSVRDKRLEMRLAVHDIPIPKDILLVRPEEADAQAGIPGTLVRYALAEGKTLYARP